MIMIANLILIAFLALMAYWWSMQGLFSAFLHLMVVIVAGSLALSLWEPLVYSVFMKFAGQLSWGLGLLIPFLVILLTVRASMDRFVPGNLQFPSLANSIGGGFLGFLSGVLTSGITIIGLGFLPLGNSLAGYEPLRVDDKGKVVGEPGSGLIVGVDRIASSFFSSLSSGVFYSGEPMHLQMPSLAEAAARFRLAYDPNASVLAEPEAVELTKDYYVRDLPLAGIDPSIEAKLGPEARDGEHKLVIIDSQWRMSKSTYDSDATLRLPPTQIRLIAWEEDSFGVVAHSLAPLGCSWVEDKRTGKRAFKAFDTDVASIDSGAAEQQLAWVFVVPAKWQPKSLVARRHRLQIPATKIDAEERVQVALGRWTGAPVLATPVKAAGETPGDIVALADEITISNSLPQPISKNFAAGLQFEGLNVMSGKYLVKPPEGFLSRKTRIDNVFVPSHQVAVRAKFTTARAQTIFGRSLSSERMNYEISLQGDAGQRWKCIGYIWVKSNGDQDINIVRPGFLLTGKEIPFATMEKDELMYLYFIVEKGAQVAWFRVGKDAQKINIAAGSVAEANTAAVSGIITGDLPLPVPLTAWEGAVKDMGSTNALGKGAKSIPPPTETLTKLQRADSVHWEKAPLIRIELNNDQMLELFEEHLNKGTFKGELFLQDTERRVYPAIGYVLKRSDGGMDISLQSHDPLLVQHLPVQNMAAGDKLYIYYPVPENKKISFVAFYDADGGQFRHEINITAPAKKP